MSTYDVSFQEELIGSMLLDNELIKQLYLMPRHFIEGRYIKIVEAMLDLYNKDGSVDCVVLVEHFNNNRPIQDLILNSVENIVTTDGFVFYQEKLEEKYKAMAIEQKLQDYKEKRLDYNELIDGIKKVDDEFIKEEASTSTKLSSQNIFELITKEDSALEFEKFPKIRSLGMLKRTANIISARTSQGKSALSLNLMNDLSKKYKCIYLNMEMTEKEIYERLTAINSGVPIREFKNFKENERTSGGIWNGIGEIQKRNIKIYQGAKNIRSLRTIITKESKSEHCIVFVDYIGYIYTNKSNQNDRERIGEVMRELQNMTKEFNVTMFVVAQLNRDGNETPNLTHLKDSGELEQTAHCVMMIHTQDKNSLKPVVDVLIPKNRNGKSGIAIKMEFDKETQTFRELA